MNRFIQHSTFNIQNLIFSSCVLLAMFLSSCREKIEIDLDSTYSRLVVEAYLTTDTMRHKVILSRSGDALNHYPVFYISNATVTISDGNNVFFLSEDSAAKGTYLTDSTVYGIPGRIYSLNISNVDIDNDGNTETYSAKSILKPQNPIDSINIIYENTTPSLKGWAVNLYARDIGGGRNFYLIKAFKNNVLMTDSAFKLVYITDNLGFEGKYFNGLTAYFFNEDRIDERVKANDLITLEMDGITEEYYLFLLDFMQEYYPKVPIFSGPSANISSNIEPKDKAAGFFAAYSVSRYSRVYK